ncbi:MAG: GIY-YIG nuclease family protein [Myxococcales bacterium]|nr:GIY-YIG nuclease family protein [Myxococcales bacterium]
MQKTRILTEIKRTAEENGGVPLGRERFQELTGISIGSWRGKFWRNWSEAVAEAGVTPNQPTEAHPKERLLRLMVELTRKNGHPPTYADFRMERQADSSFPTHHAFHNLGTSSERIALMRDFVRSHGGFEDVLALLPHDEAQPIEANPSEGRDGSVYMLKLGRYYKIGKSFRVPQRHREIAIELPEKPDVVHVITTDDPSGIEAYWHTRFANKRTNGEWFALTKEDVRAFKRRKFM